MGAELAQAIAIIAEVQPASTEEFCISC